MLPRPPKLLRWVAEKLDFQTAVDLVDKGVRPGDEVVGILRTLTGQHQEWMAERLLEHGMPVEPDNYDALYACVSNQAVGAAKLLLDRGIDLEQYQLWAEHRPKGDGYTETMEELAAYCLTAEQYAARGFAHERYEPMSATVAAAVKAAIVILSNEEARKKVGWGIVAILSPLIVLVVLLCAILSGTSQHNVSAVELCFHGGSISASATPEYQRYIEDMRNSFDQLDEVIAEINSQCEDGKSLDDTRVKAIFMLCISPQNSQIQMASMSLRTVSWIMRSEPERLPPPTKKAMRWRPQKPTWWPFLLKPAEIYERISHAIGVEVTRTIRPTLTVSIISSFMAAPAGKAAAGSLGLMSRSLGGWLLLSHRSRLGVRGHLGVRVSQRPLHWRDTGTHRDRSGSTHSDPYPGRTAWDGHSFPI